MSEMACGMKLMTVGMSEMACRILLDDARDEPDAVRHESS
jgi:hypothetical protein